MQAETLANQISKKTIGIERKGQAIWICLDSQALRVIGKINTCSKLVTETKTPLRELGKYSFLNLYYIPVSSGWRGSKKVGTLAIQRYSTKVSIRGTIGLPIQEGRTRNTVHANDLCREKWLVIQGCPSGGTVGGTEAINYFPYNDLWWRGFQHRFGKAQSSQCARCH